MNKVYWKISFDLYEDTEPKYHYTRPMIEDIVDSIDLPFDCQAKNVKIEGPFDESN